MPDHLPHGCRDFLVEEPQGRLSRIQYHTVNTVFRGGFFFPRHVTYVEEHRGQFSPQYSTLQSKEHSLMPWKYQTVGINCDL